MQPRSGLVTHCEAQEEQSRPSVLDRAGVLKTFPGGVFQAIETGGRCRETNVCSNHIISKSRGFKVEGVNLLGADVAHEEGGAIGSEAAP